MNIVCAKHYMVDVLDFRGDFGDFQELLRHLDIVYQDIDTVFAANGLANASISPCDVHVRHGVDGKHLELFSYKLLPFDTRIATEVAWNHFKRVEKHLGNGRVSKRRKR